MNPGQARVVAQEMGVAVKDELAGLASASWFASSGVAASASLAANRCRRPGSSPGTTPPCPNAVWKKRRREIPGASPAGRHLDQPRLYLALLRRLRRRQVIRRGDDLGRHRRRKLRCFGRRHPSNMSSLSSFMTSPLRIWPALTVAL